MPMLVPDAGACLQHTWEHNAMIAFPLASTVNSPGARNSTDEGKCDTIGIESLPVALMWVLFTELLLHLGMYGVY